MSFPTKLSCFAVQTYIKTFQKLPSLLGCHNLASVSKRDVLFFKRPWLYSTWDFRDSFHKLVFHVIWCGNILKTPMGHISGVAEPFFALLPKYVASVAWYSGALRKRCPNVNKLKDFFFFNFWPVFWPVLTGFFAISKKSGRAGPKK
jgi:hypothetical protein